MGLDELERKIVSEASKEAEGIVRGAREEAARVIASAEEDAGREAALIVEEGKKEAERLKRALLTPARLEAKRKVLEEKRKILEQVFEGCSPETIEKNEIEAARIIYG